MKKLLLLAILKLSVLSVNHSYYPLEFISDIENGISNEPLKTSIHDVLTRRHTRIRGSHDEYGCSNKGECYSQRKLSYKEARKYLFGRIHLEKNNSGEYFVKDVYCEIDYYSDGKVGRVGPNRIPNHNVLNCEHTWPQSQFNHHARYQISDLHHLYPTNSRANSTRSSHPFGEVKTSRGINRNCEGSKIENGKFEPPTSHKGNVARAMFYFSVRYNMDISSSVERTLKKWHELDPVDEAEMKRNQEIYLIQGNRNPFIDFPELASRISNF